MVENKPCTVCGKPTTKVLFRRSSAEVFICSVACENKYVEWLSYQKDAQQKVLQYFDEKIRRAKICERVGWASAAFGLVLLLMGVFWANSPLTKGLMMGPTIFMIGIIPLTIGTLSTLYYSSRKEKLIWRRKQLT